MLQEMKDIQELLICPKCEGQLKENGDFLECTCCFHRVEGESGVIKLAEESTYYWGEITQSDMRQVLEEARSKGWRQSVAEILQVKYPHLVNMVLGEDRIDWVHFLPMKSNLTILDVGSGWGQASFLFAKDQSNTVVSLEKIRERGLFQAIRGEQDKVQNIHIVNGDFLNAKFKKHVFDLITLIGVLEWVGVDGLPQNPRNVQLNALRKAYRLLRNDGILCIGIENRIGFNNFLGGRDHSGLRFTSLMPRFLADIYVRMRKPLYRSNMKFRGYRTYTYSMYGYKNLLKEAGFKNIDILIAHPHYAHPRCLINMNNTAIKHFFTKIYQPTSLKDIVFCVCFRALSWLKIAPLFAPHFIILARK